MNDPVRQRRTGGAPPEGREDEPDVKRDQTDYPLEQHGYADPNDIGRNQDDLERIEREGEQTPAEPADKPEK